MAVDKLSPVETNLENKLIKEGKEEKRIEKQGSDREVEAGLGIAKYENKKGEKTRK